MILSYNKKYIFVLYPDSWNRASKTFSFLSNCFVNRSNPLESQLCSSKLRRREVPFVIHNQPLPTKPEFMLISDSRRRRGGRGEGWQQPCDQRVGTVSPSHLREG